MSIRIVIVGGGYAGIMAATRLVNAGLQAQITLVDEGPNFIERTRLHEWVAGATPLRRPYRELLADLGICFVQARVQGVRTGQLDVQDGEPLPWDRLLLTVGSQTARPTLPGAEHALLLDRAADRHKLLERARAGDAVTVVGGGLTGIELAAELVESTQATVRLVSSTALGQQLSEPAAGYLRRRLRELGVDLREGERIERIGTRGCWVWCAGMTASPLVSTLGLPVDGQGRLIVDTQLRVPGLPGAWAAGDAAAVEGRDWLRMSCASAMPMGSHAARNLASDARGERGTPFRFGFLAQCISLGRNDGVFQVVDPYDRPTSTWLSGRPAAWAKELILRMTTSVPLAERRTGLPLYGWRQVA